MSSDIQKFKVVVLEDEGAVERVVIEFPAVHSYTKQDAEDAAKAFELSIRAEEILEEKKPRPVPRTAPRPPSAKSGERRGPWPPVDNSPAPSLDEFAVRKK